MTHDQIKEDLILYAAGALDGADQSAVQEHLPTCDECRAEVEALGSDVTRIRRSLLTTAAPAAARNRLMREIRKDSPLPVAFFRTPRWALIPLAASLLLGAALLLLSREVGRLEVEVAATRTAAIRAERERIEAQEILQTLQSPKAMRVTLSPVKAPIALPRVDAVYAPSSGRLIVFAANLAPLAPDKTYQLWLLPKTGAPIPAGTFRPDASGRVVYTLASLQTGSAPDGFAVTVEPRQGSATPTMPILLVGNVT